jgi:hypothetical protein
VEFVDRLSTPITNLITIVDWNGELFQPQPFEYLQPLASQEDDEEGGGVGLDMRMVTLDQP